MEGEHQTSTTVAVKPKAAKKDPKTDPTFFPQLLWATAALSGILLIAAGIIALFNRWRKRQANNTTENFDQLASFRALYERGELSQEEFDRIRRRIVSRLKPAQHPELQASPPPKDEPPPNGQPPEPGITDQPPA